MEVAGLVRDALWTLRLMENRRELARQIYEVAEKLTAVVRRRVELGDLARAEKAHVQHLTVFDLCAIGCAQYQQAGYAALWQLIENALLTPTREHAVEIDGERWVNRGGTVSTDASSSAQAHRRAILAAHGITVTTTT